MLELTVLLISITILLLILYARDNVSNSTSEGFENYYLTSCPPGYKSFYNNEGNIVCCNGDVIANKCLGEEQCTLNGKGTPDMPNCVQAILKMYEEKGKSQCPSSMPQYFEDRSHNTKACTAGRLNDTLSSPQFTNQSTCIIYDTQNKNSLSKNSCYNQKLLDTAQCFGNNCTKELTQPILTAPPLVAIGFTDSTGMHRIAYTKNSMENFLDVSNPNWRNQGIDLSKNINVAEVAKAYYVDRTMEQSHVQF
jgi:hypothetical protein